MRGFWGDEERKGRNGVGVGRAGYLWGRGKERGKRSESGSDIEKEGLSRRCACVCLPCLSFCVCYFRFVSDSPTPSLILRLYLIIHPPTLLPVLFTYSPTSPPGYASIYNPVSALYFEALEGVTMGLMLSAGMTYASELSTTKTVVSLQALSGTLHYGVGEWGSERVRGW